jgi:hypothetical protein
MRRWRTLRPMKMGSEVGAGCQTALCRERPLRSRPAAGTFLFSEPWELRKAADSGRIAQPAVRLADSRFGQAGVKSAGNGTPLRDRVPQQFDDHRLTALQLLEDVNHILIHVDLLAIGGNDNVEAQLTP